MSHLFILFSSVHPFINGKPTTAPQQKDDALSSSASTSYTRYDVFINHLGLDIKNTFISHLDKRLHEHALWSFLNRPELEAGHNIKSQIEAGIRVASLHIAIFSQTYAESTWCLDELVLMLKFRAPIVLIFFNVEPSKVRWNDKKGAYAKALKKLQQNRSSDPQNNGEKPRHASSTIQGWRAALSHVVNLKSCKLKGFNG